MGCSLKPTITIAFQKILDNSNCKPYKIKVAKCSEIMTARQW